MRSLTSGAHAPIGSADRPVSFSSTAHAEKSGPRSRSSPGPGRAQRQRHAKVPGRPARTSVCPATAIVGTASSSSPTYGYHSRVHTIPTETSAKSATLNRNAIAHDATGSPSRTLLSTAAPGPRKANSSTRTTFGSTPTGSRTRIGVTTASASATPASTRAVGSGGGAGAATRGPRSARATRGRTQIATSASATSNETARPAVPYRCMVSSPPPRNTTAITAWASTLCQTRLSIAFSAVYRNTTPANGNPNPSNRNVSAPWAA